MHLHSDDAVMHQDSTAAFPRIDAEHWRRRAKEIQALAEQMRYEQPRREVFLLAAEGAALAERGEGPK